MASLISLTNASAAPAMTYTFEEEQLIQQALSVMERSIFQRGPCLACPEHVRDFLHLKLAKESHEIFALIFLDSQHRVLAFEPLFHGTIDAVHVYPRRVLQRAMEHNSAAIILVHNHPSGVTTPSEADIQITAVLKNMLAVVDVRLLDHFIVGQGAPYSFADAGQL